MNEILLGRLIEVSAVQSMSITSHFDTPLGNATAVMRNTARTHNPTVVKTSGIIIDVKDVQSRMQKIR